MKNKTKVISVVFFLLVFMMLVSTVYAQEFKFILGFDLSSYSLQPDEYVDIMPPPTIGHYETNYKIGFLIGGGIEFNVAKNIAAEIDALYFQKGSIVSVIEDEIQVLKWNYDLNALSFPMLIKIKLRAGPSVYLLGGGELSFILTHKIDGLSITENYKTFDYGLVAGGGVEIKMKSIKVFLEGRYNFGLRNILIEYWQLESIKTNSIVFLSGIKI